MLSGTSSISSYWRNSQLLSRQVAEIYSEISDFAGFLVEGDSEGEPGPMKYETCPEEHLLFFHHVPYEHELSSGKTPIQHIYDTHVDGVERVKEYVTLWESLEGRIDQKRYEHVLKRLKDQIGYAEHWRDAINGYFQDLSEVDSKN